MSIKNVSRLGKEPVLVFTICCSILMSVAMVRFAILPQVKMLTEKYQRYKTISTLISSENGLSTIIGEIRNKNEQIKSNVDHFLGASAENVHDVSGFLELLIQMAKVSDIRFAKMVPQEEAHNQDFALFPIVIDFDATYNSLGQFVSAVERIPQMYRMNRLYIEAKGEGRVAVKLMITCYIPLQEKS
jgi:Tfp pilus assembly protein PilO